MSRFTAVLTLSSLGCAGPSVPDPRDAVQQYAEAVARGDGAAVHAMLTEQSARAHGAQGTRRLVEDAREELRRQAQALSRGPLTVRAVAVVRYDDGEEALLELRNGRFTLSSADALPAAAGTPTQALAQLRRVLARRSYAGLVRVLSSESRSAMESDVGSLVTGLEHPETLDVKTDGDTAVVEVPGGHRVRLKREGGVWKVEDFD